LWCGQDLKRSMVARSWSGILCCRCPGPPPSRFQSICVRVYRMRALTAVPALGARASATR
jgi:hypothetical protein